MGFPDAASHAGFGNSTGAFGRHRGLCTEPWTSGDVRAKFDASILFLFTLGGALAVLSSCQGCVAKAMRYTKEFVKLCAEV